MTDIVKARLLKDWKGYKVNSVLLLDKSKYFELKKADPDSIVLIAGDLHEDRPASYQEEE